MDSVQNIKSREKVRERKRMREREGAERISWIEVGDRELRKSMIAYIFDGKGIMRKKSYFDRYKTNSFSQEDFFPLMSSVKIAFAEHINKTISIYGM